MNQYAGPKRTWTIREGNACDGLRLGCYSPLHWEFSDGCRGSHARTPWGAVVRWLRWRNQPIPPFGGDS